MRTANPALNKNSFKNFTHNGYNTQHMTIDGTVNKTFILLALLFASAIFFWNNVESMVADGSLNLYMIGSAIGGLVFAMITIFKKEWAPVTAPLYVLVEGVLLGSISALLENIYPGIVMQAIFLTFGTLFALLIAYKSKMIKVTENFKLGVVAATGGIMLIYLLSFILGFFGINIPLIHGNGLMGIGFSAFVIVIAALNLVLDFDFIKRAAEHKVPKYMEWYAAFGLMVTLIWLYIEILRLLSKLRSR